MSKLKILLLFANLVINLASILAILLVGFFSSPLSNGFLGATLSEGEDIVWSPSSGIIGGIIILLILVFNIAIWYGFSKTK